MENRRFEHVLVVCDRDVNIRASERNGHRPARAFFKKQKLLIIVCDKRYLASIWSEE